MNSIEILEEATIRILENLTVIEGKLMELEKRISNIERKQEDDLK